MSIATDLADAVVQELNAKEDWPIPLVAQRLAAPRKEIKDLDTLAVSVIPASIEYRREARGRLCYTVVVDVGIQKHLDGTQTDAVAELGSLVDCVARYMTARTLAAKPAAKHTGTVNDPLYIPEHLLQKRVFTSVVSLKYQLTVKEDV